MTYEIASTGEVERCCAADHGDVERSEVSTEPHEEKTNGLGDEGGETCSGKDTELQRGVVDLETKS